jgi:hypothetical protein
MHMIRWHEQFGVIQVYMLGIVCTEMADASRTDTARRGPERVGDDPLDLALDHLLLSLRLGPNRCTLLTL